MPFPVSHQGPQTFEHQFLHLDSGSHNMMARGGVLVIFLAVLLKSLDESLRIEEFTSAHWLRLQSVMAGDSMEAGV